MRALLLFFLASVGCSTGGAVERPEIASDGLAPGVGEALAWLPVDTETVLVANGPFRLEPQNRNNDDRDPDSFYRQEKICFADLMRTYLFYLAGRANCDGRPSPLAGLVGLDFEFALEGSRRFRAPRNLGMMRYEGALVAAAAPSSRDALQALFASIEKTADERIERSGTTVAIVRARVVDGPFFETEETIFAASPRAGLLLVANDQGYIESLLSRLAQPSASVAFPADLPEWKQLDRRAAYFALRHYRREGFADDPSSPMRERAAANVPDPDAIGLVVSVLADSAEPAVARYLSGATDPMRIARRGWTPSEGPKPRFALAAPGVVEVTQDVEKPLPASRFLFHALGLLGHGIYT